MSDQTRESINSKRNYITKWVITVWFALGCFGFYNFELVISRQQSACILVASLLGLPIISFYVHHLLLEISQKSYGDKRFTLWQYITEVGQTPLYRGRIHEKILLVLFSYMIFAGMNFGVVGTLNSIVSKTDIEWLSGRVIYSSYDSDGDCNLKLQGSNGELYSFSQRLTNKEECVATKGHHMYSIEVKRGLFGLLYF